MLKFILLVLFLYLALRLVLKAIGAGIFIRRGRTGPGPEDARSSFSTHRQVEEADYEVLDTQLKDDDDQRR